MALSGSAAPGRRGTEESGAGEVGDPNLDPFQQLSLREEGGLLDFHRLIHAARDPVEIDADAMSAPGSTVKPRALDLGDSVMVVSIICPGAVIEHNADSVDGRTLTWTFRLKQLQSHQDRDWTIMFMCRQEGEGER